MRKRFWIKTADRLPVLTSKQNQYECLFFVSESRKVHAGVFVLGINLWSGKRTGEKSFRTVGKERFELTEVSHWRKLPKGPSVEKKVAPKQSTCQHDIAYIREEVVHSNGLLDEHIQTCSECGKIFKRWNTRTQPRKI